MGKLKKRSGEMIAETLVSILIVGLAMVVLSGAITAAARVNKGAEESNIPFTTEIMDESDFSVTIVRDSETTLKDVSTYRTGRTDDNGAEVYDGYYYYEAND